MPARWPQGYCRTTCAEHEVRDQLFGNASDFAYQTNIAGLSATLKQVLAKAMA
jgi:hypothetical protein